VGDPATFLEFSQLVPFSLWNPYELFTPFLWGAESNLKDRENRLAGRMTMVHPHAHHERRRSSMQDVIFVVATMAFFALSLAYVKFCDRIR
jgi:hypothetical protein